MYTLLMLLGETFNTLHMRCQFWYSFNCFQVINAFGVSCPSSMILSKTQCREAQPLYNSCNSHSNNDMLNNESIWICVSIVSDVSPYESALEGKYICISQNKNFCTCVIWYVLRSRLQRNLTVNIQDMRYVT